MSAYIRYGNFVFEDPQPYISVTEDLIDHGGRWTVSKAISIDGQITGSSSNELYKKRYNIITGLKSAYQEFVVLEDSSGISPATSLPGTDPHGNADPHHWPGEGTARFGVISGADLVVSGGFTKVEDISFDSYKYPSNGGVFGYNVSMTCYNTGDFVVAYRVLDPVDTIEYSESEENIIEITHKVSAVGINSNNTTSDALANAKTWVDVRTGNVNFATYTASLMSTRNFGNAVLMSQSENIDRMAGSYSVDEKWKYNPSGDITKTTFQKYTFSHSSGASDDYISVDVNLDIKGGLNAVLADVRNEVPTISVMKGVAETELQYAGLAYFPNSYKVKEDPDSKSITVSASFDNDLGDYDSNPGGLGHKPYFDYSISFDENSIERTSKIGIEGTLKLRKNQLYTWEYFKSYFDSTITETYLYNLATGHYADVFNAPFSLNPIPVNYSVTEKSGDPSISISIGFSDADWITGFSEANYTISDTPSIRQFKPKASCIHNGEWTVQYLGYYNRQTMGFDLNLTPIDKNGNIDFSRTSPHSYARNIKNLVTGVGFLNAPPVMPGEMFHPGGFPPDRLTAAQKYGVRIKKETFDVASGDGSNSISYKYEYTKPANRYIGDRLTNHGFELP